MDSRHTIATSRLLVARVHGLAGRRAELRAALGDLAAAALGERGCRQFDVLETTSLRRCGPSIPTCPIP